MKYKGYNFRRSTTVYMLPMSMFAGEQKNYVTFGRLCAKETPGAVPRELRNGGFIYLLPIPIKGYSRTNMAYGKDGRVYLAMDGCSYTAKMAVQPEAQP